MHVLLVVAAAWAYLWVVTLGIHRMNQSLHEHPLDRAGLAGDEVLELWRRGCVSSQ